MTLTHINVCPYLKRITLAKVTTAPVNSSDASDKTLRRRSHELMEHREVASGGQCSSQLQDEVKCLGKEERQKLLADAGFTVDIPAEHGLAMKVDLGMTWYNVRELRR